MMLFKGSFQMHSRRIRGVRYVIVSLYANDKLVFDRIRNLIRESCCADEVDRISNASSVVRGMDKSRA